MPRARKVCSTPGCPHLAEPGKSRCAECIEKAEQQRGTATERGYGRRHRTRFRRRVLQRDPVCTCPDRHHAWHPGRRCVELPTVADHYPLSRRELVARGLDPDDPGYGRGLCERCHNAHTAEAQPGGWNAQ